MAEKMPKWMGNWGEISPRNEVVTLLISGRGAFSLLGKYETTKFFHVAQINDNSY